MASGYITNVSTRRRIGVLAAVGWFAALLTLNLAGAPTQGGLWWTWYVIGAFGYSAFAAAILLLELARWRVAAFAKLSDEDHWFWVLVVFGVILVAEVVVYVWESL